MDISYMTRDGYLKLERELNELVKVKRKEIAAKIEHARSFGDIRENAEYHAAKEEQSMLEQKIGNLSARLASAQIIDNMDIPDDKAYVGATVKLKDLNSEEMMEYMLVSEAEADILENKLSVSSPVGRALLGKAVNEVVEIEVPAGLLKYQLTEIRRS
ncbi:MAG TPA: transcription elongation factor GreA [bacterium]|nr:transcription elongation factor GreA [bacterium]